PRRAAALRSGLQHHRAPGRAAGRRGVGVGRRRQGASVTDVTVSRDANYPQVEVVVDREKAASVKLSQRTISETVLFSLNSNASIHPSIFTDPRTGNQYNVVVQLDEPYRQALTDLGRIVVKSDEDRPVLLSTVAEIKRSTGPVEIERKYQQRLIRVAANTIGRDLGSISAELEDRFSRL